MSVIQMMNTGRPTSDATRHIGIHHFFIHERLLTGQISLQHINTTEMIADMLTKPLTGHQFSQLILKCGMTDSSPDPPSDTSDNSEPDTNLIMQITEGDQVSAAYRRPTLRANSHTSSSSSSSTRIITPSDHVDSLSTKFVNHKIVRREASSGGERKQIRNPSNSIKSKSCGTAINGV